MHVHDPSLPHEEPAHFLVETVNYCNKSLSQQEFGCNEFLPDGPGFPQWAFCHTQSVKSRTFIGGLEESAIPPDLGLFVIEITAKRRCGEFAERPCTNECYGSFLTDSTNARMIQLVDKKHLVWACRRWRRTCIAGCEEEKRYDPVTSIRGPQGLANAQFHQDRSRADYSCRHFFRGGHSHLAAPDDRARRHAACLFSGDVALSRRDRPDRRLSCPLVHRAFGSCKPEHHCSIGAALPQRLAVFLRVLTRVPKKASAKRCRRRR